MWFYDDGWGWGAWLVMTLGMLAFWGLVIWAIFALVRSSTDGATRRGSTPEQIVGERFARGEIHEEEYRRLLDALRDSQSSVGVRADGRR